MERTVWALLLWAMARRVTVEPGDAREIFIQRGGQLCGRWARWADGWNEAGISGILISISWGACVKPEIPDLLKAKFTKSIGKKNRKTKVRATNQDS